MRHRKSGKHGIGDAGVLAQAGEADGDFMLQAVDRDYEGQGFFAGHHCCGLLCSFLALIIADARRLVKGVFGQIRPVYKLFTIA